MSVCRQFQPCVYSFTCKVRCSSATVRCFHAVCTVAACWWLNSPSSHVDWTAIIPSVCTWTVASPRGGHYRLFARLVYTVQLLATHWVAGYARSLLGLAEHTEQQCSTAPSGGRSQTYREKSPRYSVVQWRWLLLSYYLRRKPRGPRWVVFTRGEAKFGWLEPRSSRARESEPVLGSTVTAWPRRSDTTRNKSSK